MAYIVTANIPYSNTGNRNTALTNITNALSTYTYEEVTTAYPAGITTNGSSIQISIKVNDADADAIRMALLPAWTSATRATTGHIVSVFKVAE